MPAEQNRPLPRAFATATGVVYQIVGVVYFFASAAYWLASGRLHAPAAVRVDTFAAFFAPANLLRTVATANVLAAVAGGLAMIAFGVGLQGEQPRSGVGAMCTSGVLLLIAVASAVVCAVMGAWLSLIVLVPLTLANGVLFMLAGHSASVLKRFPPPPDQSVVDDAWVEEYDRQRREARYRNM